MSNIENIVNLIENISLLELSELINIIQKKYNINLDLINFNTVNNNKDDLTIKTDTLYSLYLQEIGSNKISVIKIVRDLNNLGLREAKNLVESYPVLIKSNTDLSLLESIKDQLEKVGAKIEIK